MSKLNAFFSLLFLLPAVYAAGTHAQAPVSGAKFRSEAFLIPSENPGVVGHMAYAEMTIAPLAPGDNCSIREPADVTHSITMEVWDLNTGKNISFSDNKSYFRLESEKEVLLWGHRPADKCVTANGLKGSIIPAPLLESIALKDMIWLAELPGLRPPRVREIEWLAFPQTFQLKRVSN